MANVDQIIPTARQTHRLTKSGEPSEVRWAFTPFPRENGTARSPCPTSPDRGCAKSHFRDRWGDRGSQIPCLHDSKTNRFGHSNIWHRAGSPPHFRRGYRVAGHLRSDLAIGTNSDHGQRSQLDPSCEQIRKHFSDSPAHIRRVAQLASGYHHIPVGSAHTRNSSGIQTGVPSLQPYSNQRQGGRASRLSRGLLHCAR